MKYIFVGLLLFLIPVAAHADVIITEVAWMGTANSQYSEWVELYNDGGASVNLAGWKLYESGSSTLVFTFTKSIAAGGYLLLERTTASSPDAVTGINDEAGAFGGGGFANTGENLVLKDRGGNTMDTLDFLSGWPAGDATTKETMQWDGSGWITAPATPKAATSDEESEESEMTTIEEAVDPEDPDPIPKISPNKPQIDFVVPSILFPGVPYTFEATPVFEYNYRLNTGKLYWNMGDATVYEQNTVAPITHSYQYPGDYTISFSYTDPINHMLPLRGTKKVHVSQPNLLLKVVDGRALEVINSSSLDVDLSGWSVVAGSRYVALPPMTIIASKATVVVPLSVLSIGKVSQIALADPSGTMVASTAKQAPKVNVVNIPNADIQDEIMGESDLAAFAQGASDTPSSESPIRNRTKMYIFGAVALFVIVLSILLERFMARQEY